MIVLVSKALLFERNDSNEAYFSPILQTLELSQGKVMREKKLYFTSLMNDLTPIS